MDQREFLDILHTAERLKDAERHCTTTNGRRESVAEHSWRISLMAFLLEDVFPEADINKVIRMPDPRSRRMLYRRHPDLPEDIRGPQDGR